MKQSWKLNIFPFEYKTVYKIDQKGSRIISTVKTNCLFFGSLLYHQFSNHPLVIEQFYTYSINCSYRLALTSDKLKKLLGGRTNQPPSPTLPHICKYNKSHIVQKNLIFTRTVTISRKLISDIWILSIFLFSCGAWVPFACPTVPEEDDNYIQTLS